MKGLLAALCLPCALAVAPTLAATGACRPIQPLPIVVRLADTAAQPALLRAAGESGLLLEDEHTGRILWSAGPDARFTQRLPAMTAAFGESLRAVHLDEDGIHDRLYAGDRAGRLWRFELQADAPPSRWMQGGVWADLGNASGGRGFIAAPDITRMHGPGQSVWLNVAIGSAATGSVSVANRFYFLRDTLQPELPPQLLEEHLRPLAPSPDIRHASQAAAIDHAGFYLDLGTAQVLAAALTLEGRTHFSVVETAQPLGAQCPAGMVPTSPVVMSVSVLRTDDGAAATDINGDGRMDVHDLRQSLPRALPADSSIDLGPADARGIRACALGGELLAGCALDTTPRPAGWRREDTE